MKEYIMPIDDDALDWDEMFVAVIRKQKELIRCKDCKHYEWSDNRAFGYPCKRCGVTGFEDVDDNDFCSRAERREG